MKTIHVCRDCFSNSQQLPLWVLDYYDGPISGIITCPVCSQYFSFEMLDWTKDHRYRLFMLYAIGCDDYEHIKKIAGGELEHQLNAGDQDYEQLKSLIHPKYQPDKLMIWDNANNTVYTTIAVPTAGSDTMWVPWLDGSLTVDAFALLGIVLQSKD